MRKQLLVTVSLLLAACNPTATPLAFPTITPVPLLETVIGPLTTQTAPSTILPTPAGTSTPYDDPLSANHLSPPAPGSCTQLTPQQTEGPYFRPGSPLTRVLRTQEMPGEMLLLAGYVVDQDCQPIPGVLLDFWQADANGVYDNNGYILRGHQFTEYPGFYVLETVIPGEYPGRTEHIHVKFQLPNGPLITTQLYFPDVAANGSDDIFDPALVVNMEAREGFYVAYFNFVVAR
jgi:protocatechuate 3,4-dioxygenase beta subunit